MTLTRQVDTVVIHCSDSPNGRNDKAKDIDLWHRQRGFLRAHYHRVQKGFNTHLTSIGYHYVIDVNGQVETGRHPDEIGAHCVGHNAHSIGICLVGKDRFTPEQWSSLDKLVGEIKEMIAGGVNPTKNIHIVGHGEFPDAHKTCPNFNVTKWLANGRVPQPKNVFLTD